ncbi:MAG: hypothetical protein RL745_915, partial [Actinomycetota bacterium]
MREAPLMLVANRLPWRVDAGRWAPAPGGLISALHPIAHRHRTTWVGLPNVQESESQPGNEQPDPTVPWPCACDHVTVSASANDVAVHYDTICNSSLWPTYHDAVATSQYPVRLWAHHERVAHQFAKAIDAHAVPGQRVWIHDYQLQLLPTILRRRRPDLVIGFFLHIPFPPPEIFMRLPWRSEIVEGLRGAHTLGFQTPGCLGNFRRVLAMTADADHSSATPNHPHLVSIPASVDTPRLSGHAQSATTAEAAARIREGLGNPTLLLLGVDRLDYTKGLSAKAEVVASLIADGSLNAAHTVFLQIASPSRQTSPAYIREARRVSAAFGSAVGLTSTSRHSPIRLIIDSFDPQSLVPYFAAADVMLVTPLRDGMNLVAKEYVAVKSAAKPQSAHAGALVLSEFAGASHELAQAHLANPYSTASMRAAILHAALDPVDTQHQRLSSMARSVRDHSTFDWAEQF